LRVAAAWGYLGAGDAEAAEVLLGRILTMLWKLTPR
jgi:hypothetical protein